MKDSDEWSYEQCGLEYTVLHININNDFLSPFSVALTGLQIEHGLNTGVG